MEQTGPPDTDPSSNDSLSNIRTDDIPHFDIREFTVNKVRDELFKLNNKNGKETNGFKTKKLKCIGDLFGIPLAKYFNLCITECTFPVVL